MKPIPVARACMATAGLLTSTVAQTAADYPLKDTIAIRHVNAPVFGRTAIADLTGHFLPDIVGIVSDGATPTLRTGFVASAPAVHCSAQPMPGLGTLVLNDLAVLRGGDTRDGRDALALATDGGLYFWTSDGSKARLGGNVWNNATMVRTGQADADTVEDIVGLMANGNLRCYARGSGQSGWFVNTGAQVLDFALMDWCYNPNGQRDEVVFAHADKIGIVVEGAVASTTTFSALTNGQFSTFSRVQLLALDCSSGGKRLAILGTNGQHSVLLSLDPGNTVATCRDLNYEAAGFTCVDEPPGTNDAVLVTPRSDATPTSSCQPSYHAFLGGQTGFAAGDSKSLTLRGCAAGVLCHMLDLDRDGDRDFVGPSPSDAGLAMQLTDATNRILTETLPRVVPMASPWNAIEAIHYQLILDVESSVLRLQHTALAHGFVGLQAVLPDPTVGSLAIGPTVVVAYPVELVAGVVLQRGAPSLIFSHPTATLEHVLSIAAAMMTDGTGVFGTGTGYTPPPKVPPPPPAEDPPEGGHG